MARSSPAEGRRGPHGIQIDTTDSGQKSKHYPPLIGDPRSANRTVVSLGQIWFHDRGKDWEGGGKRPGCFAADGNRRHGASPASNPQAHGALPTPVRRTVPY